MSQSNYSYKRSQAIPQKGKEERLQLEAPSQFPLGRNNFIWMTISAILIVAGFALMLGSGSTTEAFNPEIFSPRRLVVGPTIAFIGFIALGISIIIKPKKHLPEE